MPLLPSKKIGLLLIAHGSRLRQANEDLEYLADQMRLTGRFDFVQPSYLELTEPGIEAGGTICVERECQRVVMLPYFLSAGIHVREDLRNARDELAARYPNVEFVLAEPFGRHPLLLQIVLDRANECG
jgi:sirohydrochlorin ferrochelatase